MRSGCVILYAMRFAYSLTHLLTIYNVPDKNITFLTKTMYEINISYTNAVVCQHDSILITGLEKKNIL